ncbi:hypothetical protein INR49_005837 [Caranx melampygus]|nr:hypothetical protein INR49_005837 [Caranx melampygus]
MCLKHGLFFFFFDFSSTNLNKLIVIEFEFELLKKNKLTQEDFAEQMDESSEKNNKPVFTVRFLLSAWSSDYANYYQGLWDCEADEPDELCFQRGDLIYIISKRAPVSRRSSEAPTAAAAAFPRATGVKQRPGAA